MNTHADAMNKTRVPRRNRGGCSVEFGPRSSRGWRELPSLSRSSCRHIGRIMPTMVVRRAMNASASSLCIYRRRHVAPSLLSRRDVSSALC